MINILIVEDDPMVAQINQEFLTNALTDTPHSVQVANNGQDALDESFNHTPDLILLDVYMPGLSGIQLLTKLRDARLHPQIIMLTAAADVNHIQSAIDYGVLDYLVKPFTFDRFQEAIDRFLQMNTALANNASFTQAALDELFPKDQTSVSSNLPDLPKGLSQLSLEKVIKATRTLPAPFSVQDAAQASKLSRISTKKYLDYLIDNNQLEAQIKYLSVGRPLTVYQYK